LARIWSDIFTAFSFWRFASAMVTEADVRRPAQGAPEPTRARLVLMTGAEGDPGVSFDVSIEARR